MSATHCCPIRGDCDDEDRRDFVPKSLPRGGEEEDGDTSDAEPSEHVHADISRHPHQTTTTEESVLSRPAAVGRDGLLRAVIIRMHYSCMSGSGLFGEVRRRRGSENDMLVKSFLWANCPFSFPDPLTHLTSHHVNTWNPKRRKGKEKKKIEERGGSA